MASTDKVLGRLSDWSTLVLLAGIAALPLLARAALRACTGQDAGACPVHAAQLSPMPPSARRRRRQRRPHRACDRSHAKSRRRSDRPVPTREPAAAGPTATPAPDVWTEAERAAGLRECLRLLAPVAAEVALEEPMKHGQCGTPAPLLLHSVGSTAKVELDPAPEMNCRLAAQLAHWVDTVLQPAAREVLGSRITRIVGASSYACRNMYSNPKLPLSEHATGNAVDIAGFVTADGRTITRRERLGADRARHRRGARRKIAEAAKADAKKTKGQELRRPRTTTSTAREGEAAQRPAPRRRQACTRRASRSTRGPHRQWSATAAASDAAKTTEAAFLRRLHQRRLRACSGRCWDRRPTRPTATTSIST